LQKKIRENKTTHEEIRYEDVLMKGQTGQVDGLGRAPKGVNDGNGFFFILAMYIRTGFCRLKQGMFVKRR
jgi:AdoMet-dependent heme synthase